MEPTPFNRRDFNKLTAAALGGMLSGATLGCSGGNSGQAAAAETHACRGLNACKSQGIGKNNACAGQGECATIKKHGCGGQNDCKGQGGCGETPGANDCKGKGGCGIPMTGGMWTKARELFDAKMKTAGKTVGSAPAAKKE